MLSLNVGSASKREDYVLLDCTSGAEQLDDVAEAVDFARSSVDFARSCAETLQTQKYTRRKQRNRESAKKSREQKKEHVAHLEQKVKELESANHVHQQANGLLLKQNEKMADFIEAHHPGHAKSIIKASLDATMKCTLPPIVSAGHASRSKTGDKQDAKKAVACNNVEESPAMDSPVLNFSPAKLMPLSGVLASKTSDKTKSPAAKRGLFDAFQDASTSPTVSCIAKLGKVESPGPSPEVFKYANRISCDMKVMEEQAANKYPHLVGVSVEGNQNAFLLSLLASAEEAGCPDTVDPSSSKVFDGMASPIHEGLASINSLDRPTASPVTQNAKI